MSKIFHDSARIDPAGNKVVIEDWVAWDSLEQGRVLLITNTAKNEIVYCPQILGKGGAISKTGPKTYEIALAYDVTQHSAADKLQTVIDLPDPSVIFDVQSEASVSAGVVGPNTVTEVRLSVPAQIGAPNGSDVVATLSGASGSFAQGFVAPSEHVGDVALTVSATPGDGIVVDDFETYGSDGDVAAAWSSSSDRAVVGLSTSDAAEGTKAMNLWVHSRGDGARVTRTLDTSINASGSNYVEFYVKSYVRVEFKFRISDGSSWAEAKIKVKPSNSWQKITLPMESFKDVNFLNLSAVRVIQLYLEEIKSTGYVFFDAFKFKNPATSCEIRLRLLDAEGAAVGSTLPAVTSDLGLAEVTKTVQAGVSSVHLDLPYTLTQGRIYAVAVDLQSAGWTLDVLGVSGVQTYGDARCFDLDASDAVSVAHADRSATFTVTGEGDGLLQRIRAEFDAPPGDGSTLRIESRRTATGEIVEVFAVKRLARDETTYVYEPVSSVSAPYSDAETDVYAVFTSVANTEAREMKLNVTALKKNGG